MPREKRSRATRLSSAELGQLKSNFGPPFQPETEIESNTLPEKRAICNHCGSDVAFTTTRLRSHLDTQCKTYNDRFHAGNGFIERANTKASTTDTNNTGISVQSSLLKHVAKIEWSRDKRSEFEFALASAVLLKGYPFDTLCGPEFADAFSLLPVNVQPASAEIVGDKYLPMLYEDVQVRTMQTIVRSARAIVLSTDGWSDRKRQAIHNLMVCVPQPFFFGRHIQTTEKADANHIYSIFSGGRDAIIAEFVAASVAVPWLWAYLSDSTNVMRAARIKDPTVIGYGCPSHSLNNFSKDVAKNSVIHFLIEFCSAIYRFFCRRNRPMAFLQSCLKQTLGKGKVLVSLGKTRFGSCKALLETYLEMKPALVMYESLKVTEDSFDTECSLPAGLSAAIMDRGVWSAMAAAVAFYRPITSALFELEGDTVPMSAVPACFLYIKKHLHLFATDSNMVMYRQAIRFDCAELERLNECLDRRWMRIRHPVHYLAFVLDPLFIELRKDGVTKLGREIVAVEAVKALRWISDLYTASLPAEKYDDRAKTIVKSSIIGQYSDWLINSHTNEMVEENKFMHPSAVWGLLSAYWEDLAQIAVRVGSLVASPCGGERNFKVMAKVDAETRKGLGAIKADKQVAVVYNHKKLKNGMLLPARTGDFMLLFRSLGGAFSSFSPADLVRYQEIMHQQGCGLVLEMQGNTNVNFALLAANLPQLTAEEKHEEDIVIGANSDSEADDDEDEIFIQ
jgi:hypothetical protein